MAGRKKKVFVIPGRFYHERNEADWDWCWAFLRILIMCDVVWGEGSGDVGAYYYWGVDE